MRTLIPQDKGVKLSMMYQTHQGPLLPKNFYSCKDSIADKFRQTMI
jgi:hypothetical protein